MSTPEQKTDHEALEARLAQLQADTLSPDLREALAQIPDEAAAADAKLLAFPGHRAPSAGFLAVAACAALAGIALAIFLRNGQVGEGGGNPIATIPPETTAPASYPAPTAVDRFIVSATDEGILRTLDGRQLQRTRFEFVDVHTIQVAEGEPPIREAKPVVEWDYRPVVFH